MNNGVPKALGDHSENTRSRTLIRGAVVAILVVLMTLGPVIAFTGKRPSPWGWQMYAGNVDMPEILVTKHNGNSEVRDSSEILAWPRPEPDYMEPMARFICAKDPSVRTVRLTRGLPAADEEFECSNF